MSIKPLKKYILVEETKPQNKSQGGILLPDAARLDSKYKEVKILAVGPEIKENLKPGDIVLISSMVGFTQVEDTKQYLVQEDNILAKLL